MKTPDTSQITQIWGSEVEEISPHLRLRFVWDELIWNLHVIVDEFTTASELRENWGNIITARDVIIKYRGSDPHTFRNSLLTELINQKEHQSYAILTLDLNFDAITYLLCATDVSKDENHRRAGNILFLNLFNSIGFSDYDTREWEHEALMNLQKNCIPWGLSDGPVDRDRVIAAFRQYKKRLLTNKIVIKHDFDLGYITRISRWLLQRGYWSRAEQLLQEHKLDDYKQYKKRLLAREVALLTPVEFFGLKNQ